MSNLSTENQLFNGKLKYLFLIPIALLVGFSIFYQGTLNHMQQLAIEEKLAEKQLEIELVLCGSKSSDDISGMIEKLNALSNSFSMYYDNSLTLLSGQPAGGSINLLESEEFVGAVSEQESGELELVNSDGLKVHLFFRWAEDGFGEKSLLVSGFNQTKIAKQHQVLMAGIIAQIFITFALNIAFVVLLSHLGVIYSSRKGENKWRSLQW
ncbi:MAG: hypothetical protein FWG10_06295 [Eubacteriaceae bacterium]|nr:hypothetical protein [Eubacteriaceae bacterium]